MRSLPSFLSALLVLVLTVTTLAQDAKIVPGKVTVKRGQTLSLTLLTPMDSGHAKPGDDVKFKLARPLISDGAIVLPAEWIVHGKVKKVKRAGKNCRDGQVVWKLDLVKTPAGDQLEVQEVSSYPLKYFVASGDPLWVPLDTPLKKIGGAAKTTTVLAGTIALSPLLVPLAIATTEKCEGKAGEEQSVAAGRGSLAAISKDKRVSPLR